MFSFTDSPCSEGVQEDRIIRIALGFQVTYSPLKAALLNCNQLASLSDIWLGDLEKQSPSILKKTDSELILYRVLGTSDRFTKMLTILNVLWNHLQKAYPFLDLFWKLVGNLPSH